MTLERFRLLATGIVVSTALTATSAMATPIITWWTNEVQIDASWLGSEPTPAGYYSASGHDDSIINPVAPPPNGGKTWVLGLTGAATAAEALYLYDQGLLELKVVYHYNAPDAVSRQFSIAATNTHVFHISQLVDLYQIGLIESLNPWAVVTIEPVNYISGVWTSAGPAVDLRTTTAMMLPVGDYRFRADVSRTFVDNAPFQLETSVRWHIYPVALPTVETTWSRVKQLYAP